MKTLKFYFTFLVLAVFTFAVKAQYLPSNNNSATQFKTGNRNASIEADAAFYNPAGTVFGEDGFAVEFSVLPFTSKQKVFDNQLDKEYESKTSSLFYPALNLLYKKDKLAVFSNIGITNGGGAGNYDDGLPGFEMLGMFTIGQAIAAGAPLPSANPMDYGYKSSFEGSAYGIGGSLGIAYKLTDWFSASFAVQYSNQKNHQEGELVVSYPPAGVEVARTDVDVDFTGNNMGFIFGLNLKPSENLLIAQTFRYYTDLELTTQVNDSKDGGGMFVDGSKQMGTYVPFYSLGIAYNVSEKMFAHLNLNTCFFSMLDLSTSDAPDSNPAENYKNGWDLGLALEYRISEKLNYGVGFTYAPTKLKDEYMTELEFENTTLWLNTGATYKVSDKLGVNLAIQVGLPTEEKEINHEGLVQKYTKENSYSLGLGLVYRF